MILKKAQHEIMGFVLIIIIVSIIGLVFLSLMIGQGKPATQTSVEISNILEASMYYTSDCAVSFVPQYKDGQDLIKSCYKNEVCEDGRSACDAINSTFEKVIGETLNIGDDKPNKAYTFKIYSEDLEGINPQKQIFYTEKGIFGNCTSRLGGSHFIPLIDVGQEVINIELSVCTGG